jgi:hypothetical protein
MDKYDIKIDLLDKVKDFKTYLLRKNSNSKNDDEIKVYLINKELLDHECALCKMKPIWNNKPLDLILDRRNNIENDNRLDNLRLLCPNCFYQFKTKKTIFFKKTKNNVSTCIDCGCKIKVSKTGNNKSKCVSKRCRSCLFKAMSQLENDNILNTEPQIQKDIKII